MRRLYILFLVTSGYWLVADPVFAQTTCSQPYPLRSFYLSPTGNDNNTGTSISSPIQTFNHAWQLLCPGDTLYLMDGTYYQTLAPNVRSGTSSQPITVKAVNDGQAIIDGQNMRVPVSLGGEAAGYFGVQYYVIEGLIAKNSSSAVFHIEADHNTLRRISGYNANTDGNDHVILIWGNNNLVEDCVAAGTGRKMIVTFSATGDQGNNTIRRCLADWHDWRGLNWCSGHWPWGDEVQVYHGSENVLENVISLGSHSGIGINIQNQGLPIGKVDNNKVYGSIVANGGMDWTRPDQNYLRYWGTNPAQVDPHQHDVPNPDCGPWTSYWGGIQRSGFSLYGSDMFGMVFQDILAVNNAGAGFSVASAHAFSGLLDHVTILNNGLDPNTRYPNAEGNINQFTITNSNLEGTSYNGQGARLTHRYSHGQLTTQELWPWPMEDRIRTEYGQEFNVHNFSVTCTIGRLVNQYTNYPITNISVDDYCTGSPPPLSPTPLTSPQPTSVGGPTDLDGDGDLDILDLLRLVMGFNTNGPGNFNLTGLVDIFDLNMLLSNL